MKIKDFLKKCTLNEFIDWVKDICIEDSFNNIEKDKPFKTIVINDDKMYYIIGDGESIEDLYHKLQEYAKSSNNDESFNLNETTKLFIYSNKKQLLESSNDAIKQLLLDLSENEIEFNSNTDILFTNDILDKVEYILETFNTLLIKPKYVLYNVNEELSILSLDDIMLKESLEYIILDILYKDNYIKSLRNKSINSLYSNFLDNCLLLNSECSKNDTETEYYVLPVGTNIFNSFIDKESVFEIFDIIEPVYNIFKDKKYDFKSFIDELYILLKNEDETFKILYNELLDLNFIFVTNNELKILMDMRGSSIIEILNKLNPYEKNINDSIEE